MFIFLKQTIYYQLIVEFLTIMSNQNFTQFCFDLNASEVQRLIKS